MSLRDALALVRPSPTLGGWVWPDRSTPGLFTDALDAIVGAVDEAMDLVGGPQLLPVGVPLSFRTDVIARYLGDYRSEDGARFDAMAFMIAQDADIVVWLEDDKCRNGVTYRGAAQVVERLGIEAKLFAGRCFDGCTDPDEPLQHIVQVRL